MLNLRPNQKEATTMTKQRKAELLNQIEHAKTCAQSHRLEDVIDGFNLLAEVVASTVRELGPSAHAEAVSNLQMPASKSGGDVR